MEIRILDQKPNPLLKREEVQFEIAHPSSATPQRDAVRGELAKMLKAPKDRVVLERMRARFGTATTLGLANIYESADAAKEISREHILIRNRLKEKPAAAAPGAAPEAPAKPPEAPAKPAETPAKSAEAPAAAPPKE